MGSTGSGNLVTTLSLLAAHRVPAHRAAALRRAVAQPLVGREPGSAAVPTSTSSCRRTNGGGGRTASGERGHRHILRRACGTRRQRLQARRTQRVATRRTLRGGRLPNRQGRPQDLRRGSSRGPSYRNGGARGRRYRNTPGGRPGPRGTAHYPNRRGRTRGLPAAPAAQGVASRSADDQGGTPAAGSPRNEG